MNFLKYIALIISASFLTACAIPSTYSNQPSLGPLYSKKVNLFYDGKVLPLTEVGVISYDATLVASFIEDSFGKKIEPTQIYGKSGLYSTGLNQYHFLPGTYKFSFAYVNVTSTSSARSTSNVTETIKLTKGQVLHLSPLIERRNWSVTQKDSSQELAKIQADFDVAIQNKVK